MKIIKRGARYDNEKKQYFQEIICEDENLSFKELIEKNKLILKDADLRNMDFSGFDLSGADFSDSDLRGANFSDSNLENANFESAYLTDANFSRAKINHKLPRRQLRKF
jgi:uncharacterized protein YjbI with pentapeptide repeats